LIERIFLVCFFVLVSCDKFSSKKGFDENNLVKPEDLGEYHKLKKDNIKVYLPEGFTKLSDVEIKEFHKQIKDEKTRYYFEQVYEAQRFIKGNFYNFYSDAYATEVAIHTLPYMPFDKGSAKQLLYYLRKDHEKYQKITKIFHNKIKATYFGDRSLQIFKASYRLARYNSSDEQEAIRDFEMFKTIYLITSKRKTFIINFLSPFEENFDPFIRKIKL